MRGAFTTGILVGVLLGICLTQALTVKATETTLMWGGYFGLALIVAFTGSWFAGRKRREPPVIPLALLPPVGAFCVKCGANFSKNESCDAEKHLV